MVMGSRALTYGDANITEQKSDFLVHRTDYTDFFDLHASPLLHEILAGLQSPFSEAGSAAILAARGKDRLLRKFYGDAPISSSTFPGKIISPG